MATLQIPIDSTVLSQVLEVDLGGVVYLLEVRWNEQLERYMLDVMDADGGALLMGRVLEVDRDLFDRHRNTSTLPDGQLIALDTSGLGESCGLYELGGRVKLIYVGA